MSFRFAAALLTGGTSKRMGRDKAFIEYRGQPLWAHQLATLSTLNPHRLLIAANPNQKFPAARKGAELVVDQQHEAGPLAALAGCLELSGLPTLVLAVDMPQLTPGFLQTSILAPSTARRGAVPTTGGRPQPLAALYPPPCLPHARHELATGKGALQPFVRACAKDGLVDILKVPDDQADLFLNLNRPHDLKPDHPTPPHPY